METLGALRSTSFGMLDSASAGGRMYFPVSHSEYLYSQFKYVGGTPADDGGGIPLTKLKILDTIINQLVSIRNATGAGFGAETIELLGEGASEEEIAEKIALYQQEVQAMAESAQNPFHALLMPEAGLLFSIQA